MAACRAAADESACDGIQRYLKVFPNGQHAGDAWNVKTLADPILERLRQARVTEMAISQENERTEGVSIGHVEMEIMAEPFDQSSKLYWLPAWSPHDRPSFGVGQGLNSYSIPGELGVVLTGLARRLCAGLRSAVHARLGRTATG